MTTGIQNCSSGIPSSKAKKSTLTRVQNSSSDTQSSTFKKETHTGLPSIDPNTVTQCPLTKEIIMDTHKDVFTGIGTFPGDPYKFELNSTAKPTRHAPRKVPIHLKGTFHEEVDNLVKPGILEKGELSIEWVQSYVIVEKVVKLDSGNTHSPNHTISKKLRLCLDPRDLNDALQLEPYYSRSVDELIGKFHKAPYFSIVDINKGYWMVKLHHDSKPLTCMALEHGRFQWMHLPMGTVVAGDVFQRKLDKIYEGLPGQQELLRI